MSMSNDGVQLHPAQTPVLEERRRILNELEQARRQAAQLETLGAALPAGTYDEPSGMRGVADPPREIDAAIVELQQATSEIEGHRRQIGGLEQEIAGIKSRAQSVVLMIVLAVIAVGIGLFVVFQSYH